MRVGAVSYLNSKPLIYHLEQVAPECELHLDVPSRLADGLARGALDVALIPSIEYLQHPEYQVVSDACIACRGPVMSVKLLSRTAISEIRTLALDEGSRTSASLVLVLLQQCCDIRPTTYPLPIGCSPCEMATDAVLLIGDRAIGPQDSDFVEQWDLGARWWEWAQLPFVFALWAARPGFDTARVADVLNETRDRGVAHLRQIAEAAADNVRLDAAACYSYLHDNLHFHMGDRERAGLDRFHHEVAKLGLVSGG